MTNKKIVKKFIYDAIDVSDHFFTSLHKQLIKWRAIAIIMIAYFVWQTKDVIEFLKENHSDLSVEAMGAFIGIVTLLGACLQMSFTNITKKHSSDDE